MLRNLLFAIILYFMIPLAVSAQTGNLSGTVIDHSTNEGLMGASIYLNELERGGLTDFDGNYMIENIPVGSYLVRYSYVGYRTVSQRIEIEPGNNTFDVELRLGVAGLEEIVVTGHGSVERQAFTGAATTVTAEQFNNMPVTSVDQALRGAVPGLTVNASTGTPGADQEIRIRGISSVNAGVEPLFVIDGVPIVSGTNSASTTNVSSFGVMSTINPNDIESITVLKDASATAPYGARGSNGVIVITTKQGSQGSTQYSVSYQRGVNSRAMPGEQPMDAATRHEIWQQMGAPSVSDLNNWNEQTSTNWLDIVTNDGAVQQDFYISARGGTATTNFYVSGSAFTQEGHTIGSYVDRLTGKVDVTHRFDDRVRVSNSAQLSFAEHDGYLEGAGFFGNPILTSYFIPSTLEAFHSDGTPITENLGTSLFNPVFIQDNDINRKRTYRLFNNTKLDYNVATNLLFTSRLSIDYINSVDKLYRNRAYGDAVNFNGSVQDVTALNTNYVWQNIVQYLYNLDADNDFTFRVISETQKNNRETFLATGRGIAADGLFNLNTTATPFSVDGSTTDWGIQSFTGLVNHAFKDKLYTDLSFRYEGNSRFASNERWGSFWSVGFAYLISQERFLQDINWLNYLRLRATYGKTGNASIDLNSFQSTVNFGAYSGNPAILTGTLGNNFLTWETAYSTDLGLEFEIFDRLSGGITFFRKNSDNLLFDVPLSRTTGHDSQVQNVGELRNQGMELELNLDLIRRSNFNWNIGGSYSFVDNEVTRLPLDGEGNQIEITTATRYIAVEGYAVNTWFMRTWAGVDPENGDPLWYMDDENGNRVTTNVYGNATLYDQGANALPNVFGNFSTRINYHGFYANANLYYAFGYKIYDNWAGFTRGDGANFTFNDYARQADRWQQPGDIASNPRPVMGGNQNSNAASSRYLYDGDHLRLQNLRIGYNITTDFLQNLGVNSANVYFLGTNLWTHTFDSELNHDPAVPADGFTALHTPPMRSITFGVILNF